MCSIYPHSGSLNLKFLNRMPDDVGVLGVDQLLTGGRRRLMTGRKA